MDLFASDLHLHPSRPGVTALFLGFLHGPARKAASLTLLGDLFEAWAGDDDLSDPMHAEVSAALKALAAHDTRIRFMAGNRDFLVGSGFAQAAGLTLLDDPHLDCVQGHPVVLLHGDTLCTDDVAYQQFRTQVRSADWRTEFLAQPLTERRAIIDGLRQRSETEKQIKTMDMMDANAAAIATCFRQQNVDRMIHGHTHREARHKHVVDGRECQRWVLGDWHEGIAPYLECSTDGWHFRRWLGA